MSVITDPGGEPVEEAEYDFGYTDLAGLVAMAQALENTGVGAYQGAAQFLIEEDALLTAALTIHGVEARHASYLSALNGISPFPDAVNSTLTPHASGLRRGIALIQPFAGEPRFVAAAVRLEALKRTAWQRSPPARPCQGSELSSHSRLMS